MADLHIEDFYQDVAGILLALYKAFHAPLRYSSAIWSVNWSPTPSACRLRGIRPVSAPCCGWLMKAFSVTPT